MRTVFRDGILSVKKDGSTYYRVYQGRKRIGSFLFLVDAKNYITTLRGASQC